VSGKLQRSGHAIQRYREIIMDTYKETFEAAIYQDLKYIKHCMISLYNHYVDFLNYNYGVYFNDIVTLNGYEYKVLDIFLPAPESLDLSKKPALLVERVVGRETMVIRDWEVKCMHTLK
jgi:hypothetical protein